MDKIPKEVWTMVFTQLNLRERLECMLVCHKWWSFIDDACLFYSVEIKGRVTIFEAFMNMIYSSPERTGHVKKLILDSCIGAGFNKRLLCHTFHNARLIQVSFDMPTPRAISLRHFPGSVNMAPLQPKLESLTDCLDCELASQVLTSDLGGRLHTLVLQRRYFDARDSFYNILPEIEDLPFLKSLALLQFSIRISDMERIHEKVPSIQALKLQDITVVHGNIPSTEIIPASLTNFDISFSRSSHPRTLDAWYPYMMRKYSNVTSTIFGDKIPHPEDTARHHYSERVLPFLRHIGPTLTKLSLHGMPEGMNILTELDNAGATINELELMDSGNTTFIYDLSHSNQSKHVTKLCLDNTSIASVHSLKNMAKLKTVYLNQDIVDLAQFLDAFPDTVKELQVDCFGDFIGSAYIVNSSIEKLSLTYCHLTPLVGYLISNCFPHLVTLNVVYNHLERVHIVFYPELPLQQATFHVFHGGKHGFILENGSDTEYYLCNGGISRVHRRSFRGWPSLTLTTRRPFHLDINYDKEDNHSIIILKNA